MLDLARYVGVPWVEHGAAASGADCYGLLHLVYAAELRLDLPLYTDRGEGARTTLAKLIAGVVREDWCEIPRGAERPFDAALLREGRAPSHIGVVIGRGLLLHVERGGSSVVESYRHGRLALRLLGFYRHRQNPEAHE